MLIPPRKKNEPTDHALGRSQGGFGTKLHLISDGYGTPLSFEITPGQAHECKRLKPLLESTKVAHMHAGRPTTRPALLVCDKGYASAENRSYLKRRKIVPVIPTKKSELRPQKTFDKKTYRQRNVIERCIGWMKESRRLGTRYEKLAVTFSAMIELGMIQQYYRKLELINTA